jgi:hypothetical protein
METKPNIILFPIDGMGTTNCKGITSSNEDVGGGGVEHDTTPSLIYMEWLTQVDAKVAC